MLRFTHFTSFRRRATWLLFLGILAMAQHALAGMALPRAASGAGNRFVADVCTSHGVSRLDSSAVQGGGSQTPASGHDCCKLCAAGGPLLAGDSAIGVPPAPTFTAPYVSQAFARPTLAVRTAHPPRGPPARA